MIELLTVASSNSATSSYVCLAALCSGALQDDHELVYTLFNTIQTITVTAVMFLAICICSMGSDQLDFHLTVC